jgi:hypothetical protein
LVGHVAVDALNVFVVYLLPVEAVLLVFVVEEAVVLVDDLPECLEVTHRGVRELVFIDTGGQTEEA